MNEASARWRPDMAALPDGGRFVALDSLRGIAALMVAAYHLKGGGWLFSLPPVDGGWLFVDFFFVLSGFVIAAAYGERLSGGFPVGRFMLLRLGRVYPLHAVLLAAYLALELALLAWQPSGASQRPAFTGERSPAALVQALLLVQCFVIPRENGWNPQSWSIAVEVWLYLAMALVWRLCGRRAWLVALAAALSAGALLAAGAGQALISSDVLRGVAGFGGGVAVHRLWRHARPLPGWAEWPVAAAVLAVVSLAARLPAIALLADALFALAVFTFAGERGGLSRLLRRPGFVLLGVLSYSIYMVHGMVIGRGIDLLRLVGLGERTSVEGLAVRRITAPAGVADLLGLALLAATVAVAWVSWRWIEAPARAASRRLAARMGAAREEAVAPTM